MILFLEPYFEKKPWAGEKLNSLYDCPSNTGEAWIVSGYKNKSSVISNGPYKGQTLRHLWFNNRDLFGDYNDKEFPLLLKIIDAKDNLSVQVHPNDNYALEKYNSLGKYECWYILKGTTSSSIIAGINASSSKEVKELISNNILESKLINRNINIGDLVIINPGTIHALTKGSFVLECQESSDITYRLYDYNRLPKRELHINDSLNVIKFFDSKNPVLSLKSNETLKSDFFDFKKIIINKKSTIFITESFKILIVIEGTCMINKEKVCKGNSLILTVEQKKYEINGDATIIEITPQKKELRRKKMRKVALITGITSQDGSYLAELLLEKNYEVHGIITNEKDQNNDTISHLTNNNNIINKYLFFHLGDMTDTSNLNRLIEMIKPDEIYHLAMQSHVDVSYALPEYTTNVNAMGTLRLLDAIKQSDLKIKLYNQSTCQLFSGNYGTEPQNELTPFEPKNPFATSKLFAHYIVNNYRETYNIFACNGIMFNHSSPREREDFIGRKISSTVAKIKLGIANKLIVGNIYTKRDWGYAEDYVYGMWQMLQLNTPEDFVFASGENHTVKEFIELAFHFIGIELFWTGIGINEKGYCSITGKLLVEIDSKYYRANDNIYLRGDTSKAKRILNWENKKSFVDLVKLMVEADLNKLKMFIVKNIKK